MTPEEIARRFSRRSGFRLVSYQPVALPLFRVTLKVLTVVRKEIPPIQEFVLKAIDAGLTMPQDLAGFLGLEQSIVNAGITSLMDSDDVVLSVVEGSRSQFLALTNKGKDTLEKAATITTEVMRVRVDVDGLTRTVMLLDDLPVRPAALKEAGVIEIPPHPRRKPRIDEVRFEDVKRLLKEHGGWGDDRTLLALIDVERADRMFRDDAIALVYKALDGNEAQVGFVVDGHLSEAHETAFRAENQASRLGLLPSAWGDPEKAAIEVLGQDLATLAASPEETSKAKTEVEFGTREVTQLTERLKVAESLSERAALELQLREAEERVAKAEARLGSMVVRPVEVYEHPGYLRDALKFAAERIMIISPWIRARVVDHSFMQMLNDALARGTEVFIGYGLAGEGQQREGERDKAAIRALEELSSKNARFHLSYFGDTHAKMLLCDRKFVIVTSFNWLSFAGAPELGFRDERGYYIAIPEEVDRNFDSYRLRFQA